jgi:hypothetical protein
MGNVLNEEKRQQVLALGRLGWPLRRIEQETGVRRETASAYLKAVGIAVRAPGSWGKRPPSQNRPTKCSPTLARILSRPRRQSQPALKVVAAIPEDREKLTPMTKVDAFIRKPESLTAMASLQWINLILNLWTAPSDSG